MWPVKPLGNKKNGWQWSGPDALPVGGLCCILVSFGASLFGVSAFGESPPVFFWLGMGLMLPWMLLHVFVGFNQRIGHFRPLTMVAKVLECQIYLRAGGFGLEKRLLEWPTP